ncbi:MerR family transcriptional regulator [Gemmatimonas sp.]|uniref:MerR family transcriptional regulator n=1 Tax=Gemmatimonas sp. TaxID=1962908 RepID=UPI0031F40DC2
MKVPLRIGAVAEAAGVGVQTLRYYERRGLLSARHRTAGGYREYAPDTVRRVVFIRRAQAMGFTLDEIRALLALRVRESRRCEPVKKSAEIARARPRAARRAATDGQGARTAHSCVRRESGHGGVPHPGGART